MSSYDENECAAERAFEASRPACYECGEEANTNDGGSPMTFFCGDECLAIFEAENDVTECPECGLEDGEHGIVTGPDMPGEPGDSGYPGGGSRWPCSRGPNPNRIIQ